MLTPITVPVGIANADEELIRQPKSILKSKYQNIVTFDRIEDVGHFTAYQAPDKLYNSIVGFVRSVEAAEGEKIEPLMKKEF